MGKRPRTFRLCRSMDPKAGLVSAKQNVDGVRASLYVKRNISLLVHRPALQRVSASRVLHHQYRKVDVIAIDCVSSDLVHLIRDHKRIERYHASAAR
jgi:hypothetical protein